MDRVHLLQVRDQLRRELTATEKLVQTLRDGLAAIEVLLERAGPTPTDAVPTPPAVPEPTPSDDASKPAPNSPVVPASETNETQPRGADAVEHLLIEERGRWITVQDLAARQIERGWAPVSRDPVSAVRAAANRLVASKPDLFVRDHGRYRYQGQSDRQSLNGDGPETVQAKASGPSADRLSLVADEQTGGDWQTLPRTEAVARMLAEFGEPLSPSDLSRMLEAVGRDDSPLAVGKALNHLQRKNRADTIGRAKWVLTDGADPRVVPLTTDTAQENGVSSDQGANGVLPSFTGMSNDPESEKE
jgi:hypothetical protein